MLVAEGQLPNFCKTILFPTDTVGLNFYSPHIRAVFSFNARFDLDKDSVSFFTAYFYSIEIINLRNRNISLML